MTMRKNQRPQKRSRPKSTQTDKVLTSTELSKVRGGTVSNTLKVQEDVKKAIVGKVG
jgi:hypothetical protein